ncbi:MAG: hypothetical protein ACEPO8_03630 [Rhodothermaceae bacterium]
MFEPGTIAFIENFEYTDGPPTPKIIVIIGELDTGELVVFAKTTSQDYIPEDMIKSGCQECTERNVSAYVFMEGEIVGKNLDGEDFSFDQNTFMFIRQNVIARESEQLKNYIKGQDFRILGELNEYDFKAFVECMISSKLISRGMRKKVQKTQGLI